MKLPNPDKAVVPIQKLTGYILNPRHPKGKNKAALFASLLGISVEQAWYLRDTLLEAVKLDATMGVRDKHGQRYAIVFDLEGPNGQTAKVKSGWIVRTGEDFPRLTTCYITRRQSDD